MVTFKAERKATPSGRPYASAMIGTRTTFAQAYGVWETRLRYPAGRGVWPGFFLLPKGQMAPFPEIDILEAYPGPTGANGGLGKRVIVTTVHLSAAVAHSIAFDAGIDLTTDFHTYRMEWTPGRLVFSLDGAVYWTLTEDVPSVPMYPILDLAMGASGFRVDETTPDPAVMDVEYVRVFAPPE